MNSENLLGHIDPADIDKIFNRSVNLDGESILDFINALCKLSEYKKLIIKMNFLKVNTIHIE